MTRTEAEARAREIADKSQDCDNCGGTCQPCYEECRDAIASALLAAAEHRCQGCLSSDYCPEHDAAIRARGLRLDNDPPQPGKEPKHR